MLNMAVGNSHAHLLTFWGFRTLMTCVMVPVLNAGMTLLLGDRSCNWNVWREANKRKKGAHFHLVFLLQLLLLLQETGGPKLQVQ